jgi:hypothetical protein
MVEGQLLTFMMAAQKDLKATESKWLGSPKNVAPVKESVLQELLDYGLKPVQ